MEDLTFDTPEEPPCNGRLYKYSLSQSIRKNGTFSIAEKFVPLKKESCSGCEFCGHIDDTLRSLDHFPNQPIDLNDGDIVTLSITYSHDPYNDDWDIDEVAWVKKQFDQEKLGLTVDREVE